MLDKQMKVFQDGGMMDNSGEVVNGTEVPTGSLRNEVADDIPAKLSEGEFVLPADVVRFIGLEKLMKMRDAAKAGLARMEEIGQTGNAQEVSNPDQSFADEEDTSGFESEIDSIMQEVEPQFANGGLASMEAFSGTNLSKAVSNPVIDVRYFKSDDGRAMYITFYRGKPMTPIPDGFKEVTEEEARQVGKTADEKAASDETAPIEQTNKSSSSSGSGREDSSDSSNIPLNADGKGVAVVGGDNLGILEIIGKIAGGIIGGPLGGAIGGKIANSYAVKDAISTNNAAISSALGDTLGMGSAAVQAAQKAAEQAVKDGKSQAEVALAAANAAGVAGFTPSGSEGLTEGRGTPVTISSRDVSPEPFNTGATTAPVSGGSTQGTALPSLQDSEGISVSKSSSSSGRSSGSMDTGGGDNSNRSDPTSYGSMADTKGDAKGGFISPKTAAKRKASAKKHSQKGIAAKK